MDVTATKRGEILVFSVSGRVDANTSDALHESVLKAIDDGERSIVLDLNGVNYVSSAGLRVFLLTAKRLAALGGALVFSSLTKDVRKLFGIMGLTLRVDIFPTLEEAVSGFPRQQSPATA